MISVRPTNFQEVHRIRYLLKIQQKMKRRRSGAENSCCKRKENVAHLITNGRIGAANSPVYSAGTSGRNHDVFQCDKTQRHAVNVEGERDRRRNGVDDVHAVKHAVRRLLLVLRNRQCSRAGTSLGFAGGVCAAVATAAGRHECAGDAGC